MKNTIRRLINKHVFLNGRRTTHKSVGNPIHPEETIGYSIGSLNEFLFAKRRIVHGLGYDDKWIANIHNRYGINYLLDLGCNVGYFPLHLRYLFGESFDPAGYCIDANEEVVKACKMNMAMNDLRLHAVYGVVAPDCGSFFDCGCFFISESTEASSIYRNLLPDFFSAKATSPPEIEFSNYADSLPRVDLLKVDIEGSEIALFVREQEFIKDRVFNMIVEWHEPISSPKTIEFQVNKYLGTHKLDFITGQGEACGCMYFTRKANNL